MDPLASLRRQYYALLPPYLLNLPPTDLLIAQESQEWIIEHILNDAVLTSTPPEKGYSKLFWRKVVKELEKGLKLDRQSDPSSDLEVDDAFYELLASLMVSDPNALTSDMPPQSYRTFIYDRPIWTGRQGEGRVTLLEEQVAIQAGTTGLRTWTASLHLGYHILHSPYILGTPSPHLPACLELGAGTGFLSILLAQLGADVIATDLDGSWERERQAPLARLRGNVALNKSDGAVRVEALDWTDALKREGRPPIWTTLSSGPSRTIVAADVIYDPTLVAPLVAAISALLNPTSHAIISATVRNPTTLELFEESCRSSGLTVVDLDLEPMSRSTPTFWDSALDAGSRVRIMRIARA